MSETTDKQNNKQKKRGNPQNLKPFKKGQSGNPKGRPKKGSAIADILNSIGDESVIMKDGKPITKREAVLRKIYSEAIKGSMAAVNFIADRTEGKALDRVHQTIDGEYSIILDDIDSANTTK